MVNIITPVCTDRGGRNVEQEEIVLLRARLLKSLEPKLNVWGRVVALTPDSHEGCSRTLGFNGSHKQTEYIIT